MARVTGNLELDGTTLKLKQGQANPQSLVAGSPSVANQQVRLPNESDTLTELITANSGGDATKRVKFNTTSQTTSTTLTINTAQTTSQTLNIPDIAGTDSILLANAAQTLANKVLEDPTLKTSTHELGLRVATGNTASALLTLDLGNTSRNLTLGGNLTTTTDNVSLVAASGGSSVTLPASGTLLSLVSDTTTIPNTAAATIALASANTLTFSSSITELIVAGDLTVNGTTTTINSTNLAVSDKNITVNFNGNNAGLSTGDPAGITVEDGIADGTNSRLIWNNTSKRFEAGQTGSEVELTLNTATQTLTNKTLDDTSNVVLKGGNTTGAALRVGTNDAFDTEIEANGNVRLTAHHNPATAGDVTVNGTSAVRVPVGTDAQRPSSAANGMLRFNSTANRFEGYDGASWGEIGGGGGGSGINYITNPDAEDTTTNGWLVGNLVVSTNYDNSTNVNTSTDTFDITAHGLDNGTAIVIGTNPGAITVAGNPDGPASSDTKIRAFVVNATANTFQISFTKGGSAADITGVAAGNFRIYRQLIDASEGSTDYPSFTNTSSNPVRGTRSFVFSKDAANRNGQFSYFPFTIDIADTGKQLAISMDYYTDAAYTANDVRVRIIDIGAFNTMFADSVSNWNFSNNFIFPASPNLPKFVGTSSAYTYKTTFNSTNSTQYALVLEVNTTTTTAFNLTLDNFLVGPQQQIVGNAMSEWQTYTPTFSSGFGTVASISFAYRRVGDTMEIQGRGVTGTITANPATVTIPSPFLASSVVTSAQLCGEITTVFGSAGGTRNTASLYYTPGANTLTLSNVGNTADSRNLLPLNGSTVFGTGVEFSVFARVPIAQWAGSVVSVENTQVEYAFNTTAWGDSNDTNPANTGYGPQGVAFNNTNLTNSRARRVRFPTSIQPTDKLSLEVSRDSGLSWVDVGSGLVFGLTGYSLPRWTYVDDGSGNNTHGIGYNIVSASAGDVDVQFGQHFFRATDATPLRGWADEVNSTFRWRVSKSRNPLSVGGLTTTKWQRKILGSNATTNGVVSSLTFNNLEIGKTYKVSVNANVSVNVGSADPFLQLDINNGSTLLGRIYSEDLPGSSSASANSHFKQTTFIASSATVTFTTVSASANSYLRGDGTLGETYVELEELPLHSQTSQWT